MSAVAGIISFPNANDRNASLDADLQAMLPTMEHRGPDGVFSWHGSHVALGYCELGPSIGLSESGYPFVSTPHRLVIMLNGAIHNLTDLQRKLIGFELAQDSPLAPQVLAHGYRQWGDDLANHLVGEFVLFIWDVAKQELFAVRDAVGTRFFYYRIEGDRFEFASEIKALLAVPGSRKTINEGRVLDYLAIEFDRDEQVETFYEGILRLPQGRCLKFDFSGLHITRYWQPENMTEKLFSNRSDCVEEFGNILQLAIKDRLAGDLPVAATLSGGLDSSTLVALSQHKLNYPLRTFTLAQIDKSSCEDWKCVQQMLRQVNYHSKIMSADEPADLYQALVQNIMDFDEPFTLTHGLCDLLVFSQAKAAGSGVMLDGMAGDMLFHTATKTLSLAIATGDLHTVRAAIQAAKFHRLPVSQLKLLFRYLRRRLLPQKLADKLKEIFSHRILRGHIEAGYSGNLLRYVKPAIAEAYVQDRLAKRSENRAAWAGESSLVKHAHLYLSGELAFAQENKETTAAYCQMESASPFADRRVVEFALRMPEWAKMGLPNYKWLLRSVSNGLLPDSVTQRPDIAGHPGWEFYDHFSRQWSKYQQFPGLTGEQFAKIEHLLDESKLSVFEFLPPKLVGCDATEHDREYENWNESSLDRFTLQLLTHWL